MPKTLKTLVFLNAVLLVWNLFSVTGSAQRPPQTNPDGTPYLPVNINPTPVAPLVNINPHDTVPKVEVTRIQEVIRLPEITRLPDVKVTPSGCGVERNFRTSVGRTIAGPLVVTYLNLQQPTQTTLSGAQSGNQKVTLGNTTQPASAIYLQAGQQLTFDTAVMYSGCQP